MNFRATLHFGLFCTFAFTVFIALSSLLSDSADLYIDFESDNIPLPSITICPNSMSHDSYPVFTSGRSQTLTDFWDTTRPMSEDIIFASLSIGNDYTFRFFNMSQIQTWSMKLAKTFSNQTPLYGSNDIVRPQKDTDDFHILVKCTTINPSVPDVPWNLRSVVTTVLQKRVRSSGT